MQQGNPQAHTSTPKVIPRFTSFPGISKSTIKVKSASNVQHYNPTPLFLSVNSYRLIVLGHAPNVHMIPSSNANDHHQYILGLPFSSIQSLRQSGHPPSMQSLAFQFPQHPLSQAIHPLARLPCVKRLTTKAYTYLKTIIPVITCSWKSMYIIGYQSPTMALLLNCFTSILLHVPIPFTDVANSCSQFQPPNQAFHAFLYQAHNFHQIQKIVITSNHASLVARQ